jgi:hypothetical protein
VRLPGAFKARRSSILVVHGGSPLGLRMRVLAGYQYDAMRVYHLRISARRTFCRNSMTASPVYFAFINLCFRLHAASTFAGPRCYAFDHWLHSVLERLPRQSDNTSFQKLAVDSRLAPRQIPCPAVSLSQSAWLPLRADCPTTLKNRTKGHPASPGRFKHPCPPKILLTCYTSRLGPVAQLDRAAVS